MFAVTVVCPSFVMQFDSPFVAMSLMIALNFDASMSVFATAGNELPGGLKLPDPLNGISQPSFAILPVMETVSFALAMLLKPLALALGLCALAAVRIVVSRFMPDGRIKRLLLVRV